MSPASPTLYSAVVVWILISISAAAATEFVFNANFTSTNILLLANATIQSSVLSLTNDAPFSIGRALYRSKIPIKLSDSSFSFATSFIFSVAPVRNFLLGHGFAFLFTPSFGINGTSSAQNLGLFNFSNNGSPNNHVFAVEFDSFQNEEFDDISDNHVGVDVNSLKSTASSVAGFWGGEHDEQFQELKLNNGSNYQVWIESLHSLVNVTMAPAGFKRPRRPLITISVNFSEILLDEMYVGFTAATGQLVQSHKILAWSFSTTNLSIGDALEATNLRSFVLPNESIFKSRAFIVPIPVGGGFIFICAIVISVVLLKRGKKKKKKKKREEDMENWEVDYWPHRFAYKDIYEATNGFSEANVIGLGGNGKVYKGVLGGAEVAMKRISVESGMREFLAEISSLGRLQHRNLVRLIGWCKKEKGSLILIYDYMQNGSLDKKLFECDDNIMLNWEERMKALRDVATGLSYLHQGWDCKVLHRDIKPSNVLLDRDMNARLADFGLARMHRHEQLSSTTQVVGTIGYMAPEVVRTGRVSVQADVFAFGLLVLETVSGRRSIEEGKPWLVDWLRGLMEKDELEFAVDERLKTKVEGYSIEEVERMLYLGLCCAHPDPVARPTMQQVLQILDGTNEDGSKDRLLRRLRSTMIISPNILENNNHQQHLTFKEVKASISSTSLADSDVIRDGR